MPRYAFVVHSNPAPGRETEYNDWYSNQHLPAVLQIPGVIAARRYRVADAQVRETEPAFRYLAVYEIEAEEPQTFIRELLARAGTEALPTSTALGEGTLPILWEAITSGL